MARPLGSTHSLVRLRRGMPGTQGRKTDPIRDLRGQGSGKTGRLGDDRRSLSPWGSTTPPSILSQVETHLTGGGGWSGSEA